MDFLRFVARLLLRLSDDRVDLLEALSRLQRFWPLLVDAFLLLADARLSLVVALL